jgi:tetratricopeptide (TPR) repeat protein
LLADSRRVLRSSGFAPYAIFADIQLARCALERGDAREAVGILERIAPEAAEVDYAALVLEIGAYSAQAHASAGSPEAGLEDLDAAVAAAGDEAALYAAAIERARAACLATLGRSDDARERLDRALEAALGQGQLYEQLLARRARVALEDGDEEELREIERLAQLLRISS